MPAAILVSLFLAALLSACAAEPPAPAPAPPAPLAAASSCRLGALVDAVQGILATTPGVYELTRLTGARAATFMRAFNQAPPPSDIRADEVAVLHRGQERNALVILAVSGCVTDMAPMRLDFVRAWIDGRQRGEQRA